MSVLGRVFSLLRPFRLWVVLAAVLGFATVGSAVGLMATSAWLISKAALRPSIADLQIAVVGVRFFGIARGVFRYLERYVSHDVTFRLLTRLRVSLYRALEPLAPARLLHHRGGDLLSRVTADVDTLQEIYVRGAAPPLVALLITGLTAAILSFHDPRLGLVAAAGMTAAALLALTAARALDRGPGRRRIEARGRLQATLVDGVQGLADLLAFGRGPAHAAAVAALDAELAAAERRSASIAALGSALTGAMAQFTALSTLALAIPMVRSGRLDGVHLAVVTLLVLAAFEAIDALVPAFRHLDSSTAAARRLFELADAAPAVVDPPRPAEMPTSFGLRIENLSFAYESESDDVLREVSFELAEGESLALLGPSGAGKSTLVHLLSRFWDYERGSIELGGVELRSLRAAEVRERICVVSQSTHLFAGTVRENLLVARPEASEEELMAAARRARLWRFIESLPRGLDTWIGEEGWRVSGGERQRLALARAFLKDAPVLVLDEPTVHLDTATEREVLEQLWEWAAGRTVLVITHREQGFVERVDRVLRVEEGRFLGRRAAPPRSSLEPG